MPIRFACPQCRQKLSVSTRKAGQTADCPRCRRTLTIPPVPITEPPAELPNLANAEPEAIELPPVKRPAHDVAEAVVPPAAEMEFAPLRTVQPIVEPPAVPAGAEPTFTPDDGRGFEGLEIVYDSPPPRDDTPAPPVAADLIAVPRYAIYLQGGLLAVVAFTAFVIGLLAGGTLLSRAPQPQQAQACLITGSVMYASGPRELPDVGAVVAVIPQSQVRPDEKAPTFGLRPGDPPPEADHRGLSILRELGGGYTRADAGGRFQIQVPKAGRYLVLVISHDKPARSPADISTADLVKLGPYFKDAADLLGDRRYQLTQETLRGDKQIQVAF
jgi:hypothetical protein